MAKSIRYILKAFREPFGGPLQIRRHVKALAESGFDARMVTDSLSDNHFYNLPVPALLTSDFNPTQSDICVIPEGWRKEFEELSKSGATLICLCQNHFYVHVGFKPKETFATFGIDTVICCSRQVANHVERYYGVPDVQVIPCGIEMPPEAPRHKELAISFMPRKAPYEAGFIKDVFHRCYPELDGVEWIAIDGQSHSEAMKRLGRTALFLSLAHREGFGLPPIEAMSLRTLVVGFHGGGGLEYATSRNGYWLNEGELIQCAQELRSCLEMIRRGTRETSDKLHQGQLTASHFDVSRMKTRLIEFWEGRV
jgi:glycosyltransferase involved in cell wall biosynthesis